VTAAVLGALVVALFIVAPLTGSLPLVRVAPVLVLALLVILVVARPWTWSPEDWALVGDWNPSRRTVRVAAVIVGLVVFWFVLTRFRSADINAVDFTVYYERPNFQTLQGHPLYVESADDPQRAYRSLFAIHSHWIMLPLALFYAVWASPLWLLALSVAAVVIGAVYTLRIVQSIGAGGPIASASALAFVFNANTARTLNYGFHAEVLYAWFVPWMIHAGVQRRWRSFLVAALLVVAVKEDAFLLLIAGVVALLLHHGLPRASESMPGESRGRMLSRGECAVVLAPAVVAIENLSFYFRYAMPRFSATGKPFYSNYWANYGPTMMSAMFGMLSRPFSVLSSTITSGIPDERPGAVRVLALHRVALEHRYSADRAPLRRGRKRADAIVRHLLRDAAGTVPGTWRRRRSAAAGGSLRIPSRPRPRHCRRGDSGWCAARGHFGRRLQPAAVEASGRRGPADAPAAAGRTIRARAERSVSPRRL
jgi:hypothetical protein